VRVWTRQDWLWRVTAIAGLIYVLAVGAACRLSCALYLWQAPGHDYEVPLWDFGWYRHDTVAAAIWLLAIAGCWLPMLKWRWGALAWGVVCSGFTVIVVIFALSAGNLIDPPNVEQLAALLGIGVCSSQLWVAWEAHKELAPSSGLVGVQYPDKRLQVWYRAGFLWLLLAVFGEVALLVSAVLLSAYCFTEGPVVAGDIAGSIVYCSTLLITGTFAMNAVAVFFGLTVSGRGWLWWLLLWGLYLAVIIGTPLWTVLQCNSLHVDFPVTLSDPEELIAAAALPVAALLLTAAQIWVALKARQLQSGQVGLAAC